MAFGNLYLSACNVAVSKLKDEVRPLRSVLSWAVS